MITTLSSSAVESARLNNEAEIRFHIIDPILRRLGYPDDEGVYLSLETKLEYPYIHIGHRSKKDLPLGFPDYRAGLKGARGSFIVEAKAGNVEIGPLHIEQAHSYASHAQVGANYFVLCNGTAIYIFQTLSGPDNKPIAEIPLSEVNTRFHEIENILGPTSLEKNCYVRHDKGLKLSKDLTSVASIKSGHYKLENYKYRLSLNGEDCTELFRQQVPELREADRQLEMLKNSFRPRIANGIAERGPDGRITAHIEFEGVTIHNHEAMQIIGISEATFVTSDQFISCDSERPTVFETVREFSVAKGTIIPAMFGDLSKFESDMVGNMQIRAAMHVGDSKLLGQYLAISDQHVLIADDMNLVVEMDVAGTFEFILD